MDKNQGLNLRKCQRNKKKNENRWKIIKVKEWISEMKCGGSHKPNQSKKKELKKKGWG